MRASHQRGKPSHTVLCTFNRGNNRIWKGIPISDCLREEWALVNVSSCSGGLKSQWVMISTAPNWGIRSSVWMLATPFRPLYNRISLLYLLLFLRDSHFSFFSSIPVTHSFKAVIASNKPSSHILNFFDFLLKNHALGIPNTATIFQNGANKSPICCRFYIPRTLIKISSQETKSSICLSTHVADMCIPSQVTCDCYS